MMVCLVHADLHQDHVITQLHHVTSTSLLAQRIGQSSGSISGLCSVTHQRKSGKVLRKVSTVYLVSATFYPSGPFTTLTFPRFACENNGRRVLFMCDDLYHPRVDI